MKSDISNKTIGGLKITVDTSELDVAIEKAERLVSLLERAEQLASASTDAPPIK